MSVRVLGIESTAHTFAVGIIDDKINILADIRAVYKPQNTLGIEPHDAAEHHSVEGPIVLKKALEKASLSITDIDLICYSMGPGLGPALRIGATIARALAYMYNKPLYPVHHAIGHIELAKTLLNLKKPLVVLVSGGHTAITAYNLGRWRVYGETLDITLGNLFDMFARKLNIPFPGGPKIEEIALNGKKFIEMPYNIKGNNVQYSGLLTYANKLLNKGFNKEDIVYSLQETAFSMLIEASERALIQLDADSVVLTGGVASNDRLYEMTKEMAAKHGLNAYRSPKKYNPDNGVQIAIVGLKMWLSNYKPIDIRDAIIRQRWRLDEVEVLWK